jgi:hypothetical protein
MLKTIQRFDKHLHSKYVKVGGLLKQCVGQTVGFELVLMVLICGAKKPASPPVQPLIFILKMAIAMFVETLDNV